MSRVNLVQYLEKHIHYNVSPPGDGQCGRYCLEVGANVPISPMDLLTHDEKMLDNFSTLQLASWCRNNGFGFALTQNNDSDLFNFTDTAVFLYAEPARTIVMNLFNSHFTLFTTTKMESLSADIDVKLHQLIFRENKMNKTKKSIDFMEDDDEGWSWGSTYSTKIVKKHKRALSMDNEDSYLDNEKFPILKKESVVDKANVYNEKKKKDIRDVKKVMKDKTKLDKNFKWVKLDIADDEYTDYSTIKDVQDLYNTYVNTDNININTEIKLPKYSNINSYNKLFSKLSTYMKDNLDLPMIIAFYLKVRANIFQTLFLFSMFHKVDVETDYNLNELAGFHVSNKTPDFVGVYNDKRVIIEFTVANKTLTALTNKKIGEDLKYTDEASMIGAELYHIQMILEETFDEFVRKCVSSLGMSEYHLSHLREFYTQCKLDKNIVINNYTELVELDLSSHLKQKGYIFENECDLSDTYIYKIINGKVYYNIMQKLDEIINKLNRIIDSKINKKSYNTGNKGFILYNQRLNKIMISDNKNGFAYKYMVEQISIYNEFVFRFLRKNPNEELEFEDGIPVKLCFARKKTRKLCEDDYYENYVRSHRIDNNLLSNYNNSNIMSKDAILEVMNDVKYSCFTKQEDLKYKTKSSFKQFLVDINALKYIGVEKTKDVCDYFSEHMKDDLVKLILDKYRKGKLLTHLEIKREHEQGFDKLNGELKDLTTLYNTVATKICRDNDISLRSLNSNIKNAYYCNHGYIMDVNEYMESKRVKICVEDFEKLAGIRKEKNKSMSSVREYKQKYCEVIKTNSVKIKNNSKDQNSIVNRSFKTWKVKNSGKLHEGWGNTPLDKNDYRNKLQRQFMDLLSQPDVDGLPNLTIDTEQYTDFPNINKLKADMIQTNEILPFFTGYTKLSCLLRLNQELFKLIYKKSIKADYTSAYTVDNLGYNNFLLIMKGGKSALTTNNTKAYRLIYPINDVAMNVTFGTYDLTESDYEVFVLDGIKYILTPWTVQNINLCKTFMSSGYQYSLSMSILGQRMINDSGLDPYTILRNNYLPFYLTYHNFRQTEGFLHNMRYVLFNMLSKYSNYSSLLPDIIYYKYNVFQCLIQDCVIDQLDIIYRELSHLNDVNYKLNDIFKSVDIHNVFTGELITDVTSFTEMFYTSFSMRKGYYNKKIEQESNLKNVLSTILGTDDRLLDSKLDDLDNSQRDLYFKNLSSNKQQNVNNLFRVKDVHHLSKSGLSYSSKVICNSSQILQGVLLNKNNKDHYQKLFNQVLLEQVDSMANSNGLRGDKEHSDFFGAKGYDVIYTRLLEILKEKLNCINTNDFLAEYEKNPDKFSYTFLDVINTHVLDTAVLHQVEKEQRSLGREIYVLDYKTKVYQQIIEKYMRRLCEITDNEVISIPSSDRQSYIHRKFIQSELEFKDFGTFVNNSLDCRKWAPLSNCYKYIDFINNMNLLLPKSFIHIFNTFFSVYTSEKKVYTRNYVVKDLLKDLNRKDIANLLIKDDNKSDDAYYFRMPHSFMMGIFNYLSSIVHAANQLLASRVITRLNYKENVATHMIAIAHSDDSMMRLFLNTESNHIINKNLKLYEHCLKCCNHLLSPKKCNTNIYYVQKNKGSNYLEFLSILYIKGELVPMIPKFSSNLEYNATDAGYSSDMSAAISKTIELISNGGTFQEAYIATKIVSSSIMQFYNVLSNVKLNDPNYRRMRDVPYYFMGAMDCHPMLYMMMGSDAEIIRYILSDINKVKRIISVLSKINMEMDINDSGLGLNWTFKHRESLKIKKKIEYMPKIEDNNLSWILKNIKSRGKSLFNVLWYSNMLSNRNFANSISQESETVKMHRVFGSINHECINTLTGQYTPVEFMHLIDSAITDDENLLNSIGLKLDKETSNFYNTLVDTIDLVYKKEKSFYMKWDEKLNKKHITTIHNSTLKPSVINIRSKNLAVPIWFNSIDYVIIRRIPQYCYLIENVEQKRNVCEVLDRFFSLSNFNVEDLNIDQLKYLIQKILIKNNKTYKIYTTRDSGTRYVNDSRGMIEWLQVNTYHHRRIDYRVFNDQVFNYTQEDWKQRQKLYELCLTYNYAISLMDEEGKTLDKCKEIYKDNILGAKCYKDVEEFIVKFGLTDNNTMVYDKNCFIVWTKEQKRVGSSWMGNGELFVKDDDIDVVLKFNNEGLFTAWVPNKCEHMFSNKCRDLLMQSVFSNNRNSNPTTMENASDDTLYLGTDYQNSMCIGYRNNMKSIFTRVQKKDFLGFDLEGMYIDTSFKYRISIGDHNYRVNFPYESTIEKKFILANNLKFINEFQNNHFLEKVLNENSVSIQPINKSDFYKRINRTVLYESMKDYTKYMDEGKSFYLTYLEKSKMKGRHDLSVNEITDNVTKIGGLKYLMPDQLYKDILYNKNKDGENIDPSTFANFINKSEYKLQSKVDVRDLVAINGLDIFFPKQCWHDVIMLTENGNKRDIFIKTIMEAFYHFNEIRELIHTSRMYLYSYFVYFIQFNCSSQHTKFMGMLKYDMKRVFNEVGIDQVEEYLRNKNFPVAYNNTFNICGVMKRCTLVDYFIDSLEISYYSSCNIERIKKIVLHGSNEIHTASMINGITVHSTITQSLRRLAYDMFNLVDVQFVEPSKFRVDYEVHKLPWFTLTNPKIEREFMWLDEPEDCEYDDISDGLNDEFNWGDTGKGRVNIGVYLGADSLPVIYHMMLYYNYFMFLTDHRMMLEDCRCEVKSKYIHNTGELKGFYIYYRLPPSIYKIQENNLYKKGYLNVSKPAKDDKIYLADLVKKYPNEGDECKNVPLTRIQNGNSKRRQAYESMIKSQSTNLSILESVITDPTSDIEELFKQVSPDQQMDEFKKECQAVHEKLISRKQGFGKHNCMTMGDVMNMFDKFAEEGLIGTLFESINRVENVDDTIKQSKVIHAFSENNNIIIDDESILELEGFCKGLKDLLFRDGYNLTLSDKNSLIQQSKEMLNVLKHSAKMDKEHLNGKYRVHIMGLKDSVQLLVDLVQMAPTQPFIGMNASLQFNNTINTLRQVFTEMQSIVLEEINDEYDDDDEFEFQLRISSFELTNG